MIKFNISTSLIGLPAGQHYVCGKFKTKKLAMELLHCPRCFFENYANKGVMGPVGELLVPIEGENTLIALLETRLPDGSRISVSVFDWDKNMKPVFKDFDYYVSKDGEHWEKWSYKGGRKKK